MSHPQSTAGAAAPERGTIDRMKRAVLLAALAFVGCATAMKIPAPELQFAQLVGPDELNWPAEGVVEMQFALRVLNRADEPITLRQIQIESRGDGGPYAIEREQYQFNKIIPPGREEVISFWADAYVFRGRGYQIDARAPVTVRAAVFFDAPSGSFRRSIITNLSQ